MYLKSPRCTHQADRWETCPPPVVPCTKTWSMFQIDIPPVHCHKRTPLSRPPLICRTSKQSQTSLRHTRSVQESRAADRQADQCDHRQTHRYEGHEHTHVHGHGDQTFDTRQDIVVLFLHEDEDKADALGISETLDRLRDALNRASASQVVLDMREHRSGQDHWWLIADAHPAVLALVGERLDEHYNLSSVGPLNINASTPSCMTRTFQFVIRPPWWNLMSKIFQLLSATRGCPLPYVNDSARSSNDDHLVMVFALLAGLRLVTLSMSDFSLGPSFPR
jgi:hypothetical protein